MSSPSASSTTAPEAPVSDIARATTRRITPSTPRPPDAISFCVSMIESSRGTPSASNGMRSVSLGRRRAPSNDTPSEVDVVAEEELQEIDLRHDPDELVLVVEHHQFTRAGLHEAPRGLLHRVVLTDGV